MIDRGRGALAFVQTQREYARRRTEIHRITSRGYDPRFAAHRERKVLTRIAAGGRLTPFQSPGLSGRKDRPHKGVFSPGYRRVQCSEVGR